MTSDQLHEILDLLNDELCETAVRRLEGATDEATRAKITSDGIAKAGALRSIHDYLHPEHENATETSPDGRCTASRDGFRCTLAHDHEGAHASDHPMELDIPEGATLAQIKTALRAKARDMANAAGKPVEVKEINASTGEVHSFFVQPEAKH